MTLLLELSSEIEAKLSALAAQRGLSVLDYVHSMLNERVDGSELPRRSPIDRANAWRMSVVDLPLRPPLSDDAVSRANIYGARG